MADFGIGGIVGEDNILVPNKLSLSGFDLLRGREDMGVLRSGEKAEEAKQKGYEFGFHRNAFFKVVLNARIKELEQPHVDDAFVVGVRGNVVAGNDDFLKAVIHFQ